MKRQIIISLTALLLLNSAICHSKENFRERISRMENRYTSSDVDEEVRFGREIAARILGRIPLYNNNELNRYISLLGKALAGNSSRSDIEFHFAVLDSEEVNAYSAPGGYVFITKAALRYVKDESELAGIISHEIAHITERHIVKELNIKGMEDDPVAGFARFIGGGTDVAKVAFAQAVDKALDILFKDGYKREDELESDRIGAIICASTGYDPKGIVRYLRRIKDLDEKKANVGKTHPVFDRRISELETFINQEVGNIKSPLGIGRFEKILERLKIK